MAAKTDPRVAAYADADECNAAIGVALAMGALAGTRNLVQFTTTRYRNEPLVVSGPGAGAAVTAAGLLNDIWNFYVAPDEATMAKSMPWMPSPSMRLTNR